MNDNIDNDDDHSLKWRFDANNLSRLTYILFVHVQYKCGKELKRVRIPRTKQSETNRLWHKELNKKTIELNAIELNVMLVFSLKKY